MLIKGTKRPSVSLHANERQPLQEENPFKWAKTAFCPLLQPQIANRKNKTNLDWTQTWKEYRSIKKTHHDLILTYDQPISQGWEKNLCSHSSQCMKVIYKSKASVLIPCFHREESSQLWVHYPCCLATMQMLFFSFCASHWTSHRQRRQSSARRAWCARLRKESGRPSLGHLASGSNIRCSAGGAAGGGGWFCKTKMML